MAGLMVLVLVLEVQCCSRAPPSDPSGLTEKHSSSIVDDAADKQPHK